jgi:beta-lactamase regulating signal transducer with metallopeptidase domain
MMNDWLVLSLTEIPLVVLLADLIAKVSILLVLACATHTLLGRRGVLIRSAVWNAVLLAAILQPIAALGLPRLRVACLAVSEPGPSAAQRAVSRGIDRSPTSRSHSRAGIPDPTPAIFSVPAQQVRQASWWVGNKISVVALSVWVLVGTYVAGVAILSVRLGASLTAVSRLKRKALAVDNPAWTEPLLRWRKRLGISRPVSLIQSDFARVPLLLGWLHPVIVLSGADDDAVGLSASQVDAVLLHELAHLRRGDDVWNLAQHVVQILYWPHPLIWLAGRMIAGVREQACDDLCVRWVGGAHDYRATLLAVASRLVRGPFPSNPISLGLAMSRTSSSALLRRVSWIEQTRGASSCLLRWPSRLTIAFVVLGVAIVISTIELTRARAAQPAVASMPLRNVPPANGLPVRAYNQPVPNSAKYHTVTLTLLDDETNKPLADAEVIVLNYVDLRDYTFPTDSSGRLRFEYPYIGAKPQLNIELRKNGYVPVRHAWGFENEMYHATDALTVRLRRGTTMGGIVVYVGDQPVEGVTVVMTVSKYGAGKRPENPTGHEIYFEVPSTTGPDGRWRTDSVPPGAEEINLQLIHPDFVSDGTTTLGIKGRTPTVAALQTQTDRQVLIKGVKISGRVVDMQGKPIGGAEVVDSTRGLTFVDYVRRAFTDPEGRFHFHLPRGGDVTLTAQVRGFEPASKKVAAEAGGPPSEFRLAPGRFLRGRVVDPKGKPIAGASIVIPSISKHKEIFLRRWSDAEGRFEWDSAPAESVEFSIWAEGYVPRDPVLLAASNTEAIVVLKPAVGVSLRVVDAGTGKPIAEFSVQIVAAIPGKAEFLPWGPATYGEFGGDFHTSFDAKNSPFRITVSASGYAPAQTRVFRGDERAVREVIRLENEKK